MYCFLKDKKTFATKGKFLATSYDLTKESIYDEVSKFTAYGEIEPCEGDILWTDSGYCGIVKTVSNDGKFFNISTNHIINILGRELFYTTSATSPIETHLKNLIDTNYTNVSDAVYKLPWLNVIAETSTSATVNPDVDNGVYKIKSYIAKIRRVHNIFTDFEISREQLTVRIHKKAVPTKKLDLSDPDIDILEESYSDENIGKITTYCEEDQQYKDWYLYEDGTISNTYSPIGRVNGDWITMSINNAADVQDSVKDAFRANSFSHIISFTVPKEKARFSFFDNVLINTDGRLFNSYIAAIRENSNTDYIEYQCGELRTIFPLKELI